jgi:hypothetical protein
MTETKEGCVKPARGPIAQTGGTSPATPARTEEVKMSTARVGHEAPDFEATALVGGKFANVTLSDYRGKWIVLCFYPGDFTFV